MTLQRPTAQLTIDGSSLSAAEAALAALEVELTVTGAHDRFRAVLGLLSPAVDVEPGASAQVELGYGDDVETVLTGTVTGSERRPWGIVVEGLAATESLSRTHVGRSYVNQSVGDVVGDLVSEAGGTSGEVSAPLQLAAYHVDERRSAWAHVRDLAALAGCELSSDAEGGLNFRPAKIGPAVHTLRYGAELLAWDVGPRAAGSPAAGVVPYGAASEQGADKWHLLLREPDGGPPTQTLRIPAALRDRQGADLLARALASAASRRETDGRLAAVGDASIRAGDLVGLTDLPVQGDATVRVRSVTHVLGGTSGFRTFLAVEGSA